MELKSVLCSVSIIVEKSMARFERNLGSFDKKTRDPEKVLRVFRYYYSTP